MVGTDAQGQSAVDDVLAQSQCEADHALFRLFLPDGVIVERTRHARERRVVAVAVLCAHHLLEDDCHLLLVDDVARRLHVRLAVLVVD